MSQGHNRRQRKKLHIGEFQELAFNATAHYRNELTDLERGQLIDTFIDFVEANGLLTVASADEGIGAYVISGAPRGTTTDADRELVRGRVEREFLKFADVEFLALAAVVALAHGVW